MKVLKFLFIYLFLVFNSCEKHKDSNIVKSIIKKESIQKVKDLPVKEVKDTNRIKSKEYYITFTTGIEKINLIRPNFHFIPDSINVNFNSFKAMNLNEWNKANYFAFKKEQYIDLIKKKPKIFRKIKNNIKSYGYYVINGKKTSFPLLASVITNRIPDSSYIKADVILINIYKEGVKYNIVPIIKKIKKLKN